ncbi:Nucleotide-sugar transporter [Moelleriella libera RCEF 2490]|uniref:Nucleotide-sugar transporter n=1 Tax=Moelleriella libera RCEF 2490 TaxID=1081109 RepID=A0A167W769_9HYPO|nr:Nucleotide-sugar transporter [Moelleriella libera RCEF 2490]
MKLPLRCQASHITPGSPVTAADAQESSLGADERYEAGGAGGFSTSADRAESSSWTAVRSEGSVDVTFGLGLLALFYVLINNLIFVSYQAADPATIQLTKSGVTCITALVLIFALKTEITSVQWLAIILQVRRPVPPLCSRNVGQPVQVCGLVVTQYDPTAAGGVYPLTTYLLLIFQVFPSAVAGVMNQALLRVGNSSPHANNIILYGAGAVSNLLCHMLTRTIKPEEPGFFEGYGSLQAMLIILNNVLIGLAMNAVYKCRSSPSFPLFQPNPATDADNCFPDANAIIECLDTAFATAILIFHPLVVSVSGSVVVFGASWLYVVQAAPPPSRKPDAGAKSDKGSAAALLPLLPKFFPVLYGLPQLLNLARVGVTCVPDMGLVPSHGKAAAAAGNAANTNTTTL